MGESLPGSKLVSSTDDVTNDNRWLLLPSWVDPLNETFNDSSLVDSNEVVSLKETYEDTTGDELSHVFGDDASGASTGDEIGDLTSDASGDLMGEGSGDLMGDLTGEAAGHSMGEALAD